MAIILHPPKFRFHLVESAVSFLGVREVGTNGGKQVRLFQSATSLKPGDWPWCAAFVCFCYREAAARFCPGALPTRPVTPRAFGFESWGKDHALFLSRPSSVRQGDILVFSFSHVGIATASFSLSSPYVLSVEGNTNSKGHRDGDGVFIRNRSFSSIRSIVRLYESTTPQS